MARCWYVCDGEIVPIFMIDCVDRSCSSELKDATTIEISQTEVEVLQKVRFQGLGQE